MSKSLLYHQTHGGTTTTTFCRVCITGILTSFLTGLTEKKAEKEKIPISETGLLPKRNNGYTLIELVVVVFIIGLFLAIVTPRLLDRLFEVRLTGSARQIG